MLSSLHEEVSIFIDNDWFVFATLSRDLVCNIAADAKDTTLKFEIPSSKTLATQFSLQSWRGSPSFSR